MKRFVISMVALAFCALCVSGQDGARALVQRAIEAQGGQTNVAKLTSMRIKVEGMASLMPGQPDVPIIIEDAWHMPDKYRSSSTFEIGGQKVTQTQALVGDKGWIQINGQTQDLPKEAVTEMKEQKEAEDLDHLGFLGRPDIEIAAADAIEVEGKPAHGIVVKRKGRRDVKLYFDDATGLLVKREHRVLDPSSGKEALQEVIFSDYQIKDGLKHYKRIKAIRDGRKFVDAKVTEIEFFEKPNDSLFARP